MIAFAKVLLHSAGVDVGDSGGLQTVMIFCGAGLLLSLLASGDDLWPEPRCGPFLKV
jgi:hypothetical protein